MTTVIAISLTFSVYLLTLYLHRRFFPFPIAHPLVITVVALFIGLSIAQIPVSDYQAMVAPIHWFLGPVTVALAVPIYQQWQNIRMMGKPLLLSIIVGGFIAPILAWGAVFIANSPSELQMTMFTKSITTPLAMTAAESIGGIPSFAAVVVIITGIVGATFADVLFRMLNIKDKRAQGIALGTVAHAVGTAKAVSEDSVTGAFSTVALCVNGVVTAVLLPLLVWWFS